MGVGMLDIEGGRDVERERERGRWRDVER